MKYVLVLVSLLFSAVGFAAGFKYPSLDLRQEVFYAYKPVEKKMTNNGRNVIVEQNMILKWGTSRYEKVVVVYNCPVQGGNCRIDDIKNPNDGKPFVFEKCAVYASGPRCYNPVRDEYGNGPGYDNGRRGSPFDEPRSGRGSPYDDSRSGSPHYNDGEDRDPHLDDDNATRPRDPSDDGRGGFDDYQGPMY